VFKHPGIGRPDRRCHSGAAITGDSGEMPATAGIYVNGLCFDTTFLFILSIPRIGT